MLTSTNRTDALYSLICELQMFTLPEEWDSSLETFLSKHMNIEINFPEDMSRKGQRPSVAHVTSHTRIT